MTWLDYVLKGLIDPMPLESGSFEHRDDLSSSQVIVLSGKGVKLALQISL